MSLVQHQEDSATLTVDGMLQQAINCYQAARFSAADELYHSILQIDPSHPGAHYNLGLMNMKTGKPEMGLPHLQAAWEADPSIGQYWLTLTECLLELDHADDALMIIEDALIRGIDSEQAILLLIKARNAHDMVQPSIDSQQKSSEVCSTSSPRDKKRNKKPKIKSIKLNVKYSSNKEIDPSPQEIDLLVHLFNSERFTEAEELAQKMIISYPRNGFGWKSMGVLLGQSGRSAEALIAMQKAASLVNNDAEVHYNLGNIYKDLNCFEEAEASFRCALKINVNHFMAHNNLGLILVILKRIHEAEICVRRALQIKPDYAEGHGNLGSILTSLGRADEAVVSLRRALEIKPNPVFLSPILFALSHKAELSAQDLFAEHSCFGSTFEAALRDQWRDHVNLRDSEKCLQIGFVSGDFYSHAVTSFIEPVLIHMTNYPQLVLHAYSDPEIEDGVTERFRRYFKHWDTITGLSDAVLADKIRADGIDILIDLSGHTARNRLLTFARKPAPVQVSWIGYPGTTGLQAMDYYLADPFFLPPGQFDDQFTEKIVHLPATAPFSPSDLAPSVNPLPALSNGYITFGSFNRSNKISPSVVALWSQLLRALPSSRMLLGAMSIDGKNDSLIEMFAREGIASERLILRPRCETISYLAVHQQVDICLDTFPYSGGTTTCHALWMGIPTLTLAGKTAPGRQGAGNLGHFGLGAFIAEDQTDFVEKGLSWANNLVELSSLRLELRERFKQSAMGQPAVIAAGLERALRIMWRRWCEDLPTESFEVSRRDVDSIIRTDELKEIASKQQISPIYVTQPLLPPLEEFIPYLQQIWDSKQLTNGGPFHQQLEQELCEYLGVKHISLFSNGTLALMTAMQSLRITGEVITTPYSFVATAHSLLWNGIKPVFVDIDPVTLNLDPRKIEAAITPQTTAIMPVHCYGHPCDVKGIQKIADNYGLKVIYDAAHAFGVQCPDGSILNHGDLSVLSFHATKVFNTFEGGAIVCHDAKTKQRIDQLKNFGFVDEVTVVAAGINGKMSEVNAAFGLLQLKSIDQALQSRKLVDIQYRKALAGVKGVHCLSESGEKVANYAYFPILVGSDYPLSRDELYQKLRDNGVYARRYFYPIVSDFPMYRGMPSAAHSNLPVAKKMAEQVICLPIYPDLSDEQIDLIVQLIMNKAKK